MKSSIIAIAGGSGSGKTTLAKKICGFLGDNRCGILSQDNYYKDQSKKFDGDGGAVNFDHPSSIDFDLLSTHIQKLKKGETVEVPRYDFVTHSRLPESDKMDPVAVIIVDGTLLLSQTQLLNDFDHKVFVDVPEPIRFQRRLKRDVQERGRTPEGVQKQYALQVKPMHDAFVEPSKKEADHLADDNFDIESFCNIILQK